MPTTEAQLRALADANVSGVDAAKQLGIKVEYLYVTARVLGIKFNGARGMTAPVHEYLEGIRSGMTCQEVATRHGLRNASTVHDALKRAGLPTCTRAALRQQSNSAQA
ncbi:MAG: hypothetical protein WC023_06430 [Rhodocyclaceae bacterium]